MFKEPDKSGFEVVASFESLLHNSLKGIFVIAEAAVANMKFVRN